MNDHFNPNFIGGKLSIGSKSPGPWRGRQRLQRSAPKPGIRRPRAGGTGLDTGEGHRRQLGDNWGVELKKTHELQPIEATGSTCLPEKLRDVLYFSDPHVWWTNLPVFWSAATLQEWSNGSWPPNPWRPQRPHRARCLKDIPSASWAWQPPKQRWMSGWPMCLCLRFGMEKRRGGVQKLELLGERSQLLFSFPELLMLVENRGKHPPHPKGGSNSGQFALPRVAATDALQRPLGRSVVHRHSCKNTGQLNINTA